MKKSAPATNTRKPRRNGVSANVRMYGIPAAFMSAAFALAAWVAMAQEPGSTIPPAPEAHWAWGSDAAMALSDATGNGHDAQILSPSHAAAATDPDSALAILFFDGVADTAESAAHGHVVCASLPPPGAAFAVSALLNPAAGQVPYAPIVSRVADPSIWDGGFAVYIGPEGTVCAFVGDFADPASRLDSGVVPAPGEWTHAALSYNGAEAVLHIDGAETARASVPDADLPAAPLAIGSLSAMGVTRPWNGALADIRLYSLPLSASDALSAASASIAAYTAASPENGEEELADEETSRIAAAPPPPDSDGDGVPDGEEVRLGRDPFAPGATAPASPILAVHTPME